ncbi:MAG: hypothetical protein MJK04_27765, partial [Psychrosphaera sp.]|nr:hypothetical protein [Psychrosphaera sp.]
MLLSDASITPKQIQQALGEILASPFFAKAVRPASFLRYVVNSTLNDKNEQIKGYTIGIEVYGRDVDFDPQEDNIVRVNAGRVRQKLAEYYDSPLGRAQKVLFKLPERTYVPVYLVNPAFADNDQDKKTTLDGSAKPMATRPFWIDCFKKRGFWLASAVLIVTIGVLTVGVLKKGFFDDHFTTTDKTPAKVNHIASLTHPAYKAMLLGDSFFQRQDYAKALPNYRLAVSLMPHNSEYKRRLGRCYDLLYDFDNALTVLQATLTLDTEKQAHSTDV